MNRRDFLTALTLFSVAVIAAARGFGFLGFGGKKTLTKELKPLFDPSFEALASKREAATLLAALKEKKVISSNGSLNPSVVADLAKTDELHDFRNLVYTQTELQLYTLAFLVGAEEQRVPSRREHPRREATGEARWG